MLYYRSGLAAVGQSCVCVLYCRSDSADVAGLESAWGQTCTKVPVPGMHTGARVQLYSVPGMHTIVLGHYAYD